MAKDTRYCIPGESGLYSTASAIGRRIGKLMDALGTLDRHSSTGPMANDCHEFGVILREKLRADGWRITVNARDKWQVLPPK